MSWFRTPSTEGMSSRVWLHEEKATVTGPTSDPNLGPSGSPNISAPGPEEVIHKKAQRMNIGERVEGIQWWMELSGDTFVAE